MIDLLTIAFFTLVIIAICTILYFSYAPAISKTVTISPDIANDIVGEVPRCPDCLSTDLELRDNYSGVTWAKPKGADGNYFYCKKCGRSFGNENWKEAKETGITPMGTDD